MRQIWIPKIGDPSVLDVRETEDPTPGDEEVRIQVAASGVNFADLMARMGLYPDAPPLPAVVGYEVSGVIDAVGPGVTDWAEGDRVVALTRFGGNSSAVICHQAQLAKVPDDKDLVEAASIPVTGLTSWMMLEIMGRVREGDRVLVHSAGGGVGLMALDLLKWRGAYAVGTASKGKHAFLLERGYDQVVDYRNEDFHEVLKDQDGFDLILDPVGGESWGKGLDLLRAGGRIICFGMSANATGNKRSMFQLMRTMSSVPWLKVNPISLMNTNNGVMGVNMGHMWHERDRVGSWTRKLMELWSEGVIRPVVHATVPFDNAPEAHRILHDRENFGKVLLIP
ncbi:MAG: zinc-binding dehydrogenase [Myxococcales bacterium]|nr:zinc-binding dehydrogenase [Myxococcales bacterium]